MFKKKKMQHKRRKVIGIILRLLFCYLLSISSYAQDIQTLHQQLSLKNSDEEKVPLLWQMGKMYQNEKAHSKAIEYLEQAFELGTTILNINDQILISLDIISSGLEIKNYDLAQKYYQNLLMYYTHNNDTSSKINTLNKIAEVYEKTGEIELALQTYIKVSEYYLTQKNIDALINNYNNIGFLYYKKEDLKNSIRNYLKALHWLDQCLECINKEEVTTLYLNVGNTFAKNKDILQAEKYFKNALIIQKNNNIRTAEIKSFMGSGYFINNKISKAINVIEESIEIIEKEIEQPESKQILLQNYFLMSKIYEQEDNKSLNGYSKLYLKLKEELDEKQHQNLKSTYENQLLVEINENKLLSLITEKEKTEKKNSLLENAAKEKELLIKNTELDLLKREQELQLVQIHNQVLEKEKMRQSLKMAELELEDENQKKKVIQQQLLSETIKAEIAKQQKKLLEANFEKELHAKQLQEAKTQSKLRLFIIFLMILLLFVGFIFIINSNRARKALANQNNFIQKQHKEIKEKNIFITEQNKELTQIQEEILQNSKSLSDQNTKLSEAHLIIEIQNKQMKSYMESLEEQVQERTLQLSELNQELIKNNQQLEQFGFIVAHNLRGPIARLLGLSTIFRMSSGDETEKEYVVNKIQQEITMLDTIITDLNVILQIKKGIENEVVDLLLDEKVNNVIENIKEDIRESGATIVTDFSQINKIKFIQPYLHSILYNLINNAIKYRSPDRIPIIKLSTTKPEHQTICLKVEDNGLGMDLNQHGKNIFGLYKRFHLHKEGKGLGLYLVKTQMEMLGGRIEIESTPDIGTTFYLYFLHIESKKMVLV